MLRQIIGFLFFMLPGFSAFAQLDFSTANPVACVPFDAAFTASGSNITSYQWDFGNGWTSTSSAPMVVYQNPGLYSVKLKVTYANGTSDSIIKPDYVQALESPTGQITAVVNQSCSGQGAVQFSYTGTAYSALNWLFGDGTNSAAANPLHTYHSPGSFTPSLLVTASNSCQTTIAVANPILVHPSPSATITVQPALICSPSDTLSFSVNQVFASMQWHFGDGSQSSLNTPQHLYSSAGYYNVELIATNSFGCTDTITPIIPVHVPNEIHGSINADVHSGCVPLDVHFSANFDSTFSALHWNFGNGTFSSGLSPDAVYTASGNYPVSVNVFTVSGCQYQFELDTLISIPPEAIPSFALSDTLGCSPFNVQFTNTSQFASTYWWEFGDGQSSTQVNPSHVYLGNHIFDVTLHAYNAEGCETVYTASDTLRSMRTVPSLYAQGLSGCAPHTVQFYNVTAGQTQNQYIWYFGDGTSSTQLGATHTYTTPGNYTVSLVAISPAGCRDSVAFPDYVQVLNIASGAMVTMEMEGCAPYQVSFADSTIGAAAWNWNFGDGTTSTDQSVMHTYSQPGEYVVSLQIDIPGGCTHLYPALRIIRVGGALSSPQYSVDCNSNAVVFDAPAGAATVNWEIGTFSSTQQQFSVPLAAISGQSVSAVYTDSLGCLSSWVLPFGPSLTSCSGIMGITGNPGTPGTNPFPTQQGCSPFHVMFDYTMWGGAQFQSWIFGDGNTSSQLAVEHVYTGNDTLDVGLVYVQNGMMDTLWFPGIIIVSALQSQFTISNMPDCIDHLIVANDLSSGATSRMWNFNGTSYTGTGTVFSDSSSSSPNFALSETVSNNTGCSSSSAQSFFYASVLEIWANDYLVCNNQNVFFTCNSNGFASYLWEFGDGTTSTLPNPQHVFTSAGSFYPRLTVTDQYGCSITDSLQQPIVNYLPDAQFSIDSTISCNAQTIAFVNQSTGHALPASAHVSWSFGDGTTSNQMHPVHTYQNPGVYQVKLVVTGGGCSDQLVQQIIVGEPVYQLDVTQNRACFPMNINAQLNGIPNINCTWNFGNGSTASGTSVNYVYNSAPQSDPFVLVVDARGCSDSIVLPDFELYSVQAFASGNNGCAPQATNFTAYAVNPSVYNWMFGDGNSQTDSMATISHVYALPGTYQPVLFAEDLQGCRDTVEILPVHVQGPQALISADTLAACAPFTAQFYSNSVNANSLIWDFGDSSSSVLANPQHLYTNPGVYEVKLIANSVNGCSDTSASLMITVYGLQFTIAVSDDSLCIGETTQFSHNAGSVQSCTWWFGDGTSSNLTQSQHAYNQAGVYDIVVSVTDSNSCVSTVYANDLVLVHPAPSLSVQILDTSGCAPFGWSGQISYNPAISNVSWNLSGGSVNASGLNLSGTLSLPGTYELEALLTDQYSCSANVDVAQFIVFDAPSVTIQALATDACQSQYVHFSSQSNAAIAASQWYDNGILISSDSSFTDTLSIGSHSISGIFTDQNGCTDTTILAFQYVVSDTAIAIVPVIRRVTVNNFQHNLVEWNSLNLPSGMTYSIYRSANGTGVYQYIASVPFTQLSFTDSLVGSLKQSWCYKIKAEDSCGRSTGFSAEHCSIGIQTQFLSVQSNLVEWNAYTGSTVSAYHVYRKSPAQSQFQLYAVFPAGIFSFTDTLAVCQGNFQYYVEGIGLNGQPLNSSSDSSGFYAVGMDLSQLSSEIIRATVSDDQDVLVEWKYEDSVLQYIAGAELYRFEPGQNALFIGYFPVGYEIYLDTAVDVHTKSYQYFVRVITVCEQTASQSDPGSSILLNAERLDDFHVKLQWTPYIQWQSGVDRYEVQKQNPDGSWTTIEIVPGQNTTVIIKD